MTEQEIKYVDTLDDLERSADSLGSFASRVAKLTEIFKDWRNVRVPLEHDHELSQHWRDNIWLERDQIEVTHGDFPTFEEYKDLRSAYITAWTASKNAYDEASEFGRPPRFIRKLEDIEVGPTPPKPATAKPE